MGDENKLVVWGIAAVVLVGAAIYLTVFGGIAKIKQAFGATQPPAGGSSTSGSTSGGTSTGNTGNTGNPGSASLNVAVQATDASDIATRTWAIYTSNPGAYTSGGAYAGGAPVASGFYPSGSTANFNISGNPASLWLTISQSGGSGYGTYAGTITVNGQAIQFQGVDANHPFQFSP